MKHLLWLAFFLPLIGQGQKLDTRIDPFFGDTTVYTRFQYLTTSNTIGETFSFSFQKAKGKCLLRLSLCLNEPLPTIRQGSELHFKLASGKVITLKAKDSYPGKPIDNDISKGASIHPAYEVDEAALDAFRSGRVRQVRVHYDATYKDYDLSEYSTADMQKAVQALFP
jgi:hypothetical protein